MINTYQTSMAPPPVPPRLAGSQPVLFPAPLPPRRHSKSLIRFLVAVVLLHLFLSIGGFIYLYYNDKMLSFQLPSRKGEEGQTAQFSSEKQDTSHKTLAQMAIFHPLHSSDQKSAPGYLQWNIDHSVLKNVAYYHNSWLTILEPGDYYIYSGVTFSRGDSERPLVSMVKLRKNENDEESVAMKAYCNLSSSSGSPSIRHLCTATQAAVIRLERGNQLRVWVQDLLLVNYEEGATTFGMYKL
ncbi:uncharacterized protein ACO6RY_15235 [Pungitius sinensis]